MDERGVDRVDDLIHRGELWANTRNGVTFAQFLEIDKAISLQRIAASLERATAPSLVIEPTAQDPNFVRQSLLSYGYVECAAGHAWRRTLTPIRSVLLLSLEGLGTGYLVIDKGVVAEGQFHGRWTVFDAHETAGRACQVLDDNARKSE